VAEVQLPQLGESVTEGIITAWLVKPGDTVTVDQPIVEISTDKVDTEIPSPIAGTITELRADVDDTVQVGQVIAVITADNDATPAPKDAPANDAPAKKEAPKDAAPKDAPAAAAPAKTEATKTAPAPAKKAAAAPAAPATPPAAVGGGQVTSPFVRRALAGAGISAGTVSATGPGGRISRADAARAVAGRGDQAPSRVDFGGAREKVEPLTRIRRAIANSMMRSLQTTAQLTAAVEADVTSIMHLRERHKDAFKAENGVSLSPLAMISRVVVDVLSRHPVLNASIDTETGTVTYHDFINLGIAVDTERGLLVPNIKDAQALDVAAMARSIGDLAARTRERRVTPDDISGGTFTITNTGSRGTLFDTPILNPPEAAILATCAIEKRPVVVEDELGESVAIRWMTYLCLTYDHRLVDGADAARFLSEVKDRLAAVDLSSEVAST
jgi:2-oxoglutarate dehydrogenase E2 component (dihydrolipoamide succinyltransferase)